MRCWAIPASLLLALTIDSPVVCASRITYAEHIAPIIYAHCSQCHRPGEAAPFSLLGYDDVRRHLRQIVDATHARYMPPWLPEPGHGDFAGDRRLTKTQIALLAQWEDAGAPRGDVSREPPAPQFPGGWTLGTPDLVLHLQQPYALAGRAGDVFRNFVLPVDLPQTRYVRAMELRPGNPRLVHHANVIVDSTRSLRHRDGEDGSAGFAGMEISTESSDEFDPDSHFLFWKPGSPVQVASDDMGWKLQPHSDLILNLHLQPSGKPEMVNAAVGLYFANAPPKRFPMLLQLEHDGAIQIPAGSTSFELQDRLKLPVDVDVLAVYPHAHYLGKRMEAWAELPDGTHKPLLLIQNWNVDWQSIFTYRNPVHLPGGTTLGMRITYDNSAQNPRNPSSPPVPVRSGNRSTDEMGHVWFQVLPSAPATERPLVRLQVALMRRRLEKYPADFVAHFNLGAALQLLDKHEEALPYLTRAVALQPKSPVARNNLAISLLATERPAEALDQLQRVLLERPDYEDARYNLARAYAAQGNAEQAISNIETYLRAVPDDAAAQEFAGGLLASLGRPLGAARHFRLAASLQPNSPGFQTNLGTALARSGDYAGAVSAFEQALVADPQDRTARLNLERARLLLRQKQQSSKPGPHD